MDFKQVSAVGLSALVGAGLALGGASILDSPQDIDTTGLASADSVSELKLTLEAQGLALETLSENFDELHADYFAEDLWLAEAEILATDELENDNYFALEDHLNATVTNVVVDNVDVSVFNVEDRDATVELELDVRYLDEFDIRRSANVNATAVIEDGEAISLSFA